MKFTPITIKSLYLKLQTSKQTNQLRNIKKFDILNNFIKNYQIKEYGQLIILPKKDYEILAKSINLNPNTTEIPIWFDSTKIYCSIIKGSLEVLKNKLKDKLISVETFDDCVNKYNLK